MGRRIKERTGNRHGCLTVLGPTPLRDHNGCVMWRCKCDCGRELNVAGSCLRPGKRRQYCSHKCPVLVARLRREGVVREQHKLAKWAMHASRMRESGLSLRAIAADCGVSYQRVQEMLYKLQRRASDAGTVHLA